ncbi:ABC transporter ATP-binding protein [Mucisphaera calidilacus]|uniref:Putative ABC transporter ATP-binding protein n=1 Tax=Mucisphaera calidilacus TaxID=2527982 RepID=A0A518BZK2_9BACT|nr:ABC transporter ATP-binding protein [Mucisphaera calidilacus]QDU72402.1 putative ABC transporter ATP-binding protein [Mucisphaera calidilacus]
MSASRLDIETADRAITRRTSREQEAKHRPLDLGLIRRLWTYTEPYATLRNTLIVVVLTRALTLPLVAWLLSSILLGPVQAKDVQGIIWGAVEFAALAAFTAVVFRYRMMLSLRLGERVLHDLRNEIFVHLQKLPMRFYDTTKLGRIISRMTSDAESMRQGVQDVLFVTLVQLGHMFVAAAIMAWIDLGLFLALAVMAPILWFVVQFFRSRLTNVYRQIQESFSRVTATLAESVSGVRVTQSFVRQDVNAELFAQLVEDHSRHHHREAQLRGVFLPLLELNNQFFIALILAFGALQILRGTFLAPGSPEVAYDAVVYFFFLTPLFFGPVIALGRQYNIALAAMAGAERVFNLLDTEPQQLDAPNARDIDHLSGSVQFDDACFEYEPGRPVLHNINFTVEPGQMIALVGETGSGKSTIIKLISKFYLPTSGQILLDGIPTHDITSASLAQHLGIVLQNNFLFTGTVMDNIRVARHDATDEQVIDAVRRLDCLDLLEALPLGLRADVGERGGNLSLGQRQLVCFARAMLADPAILILDEATSSVDTITEARIQRSLARLLAGRTSFVVAHRLSTIRHADRVIVLRDGNLAEAGTHAQLLTRGGIYAGLYRQFVKSGI